MNLGKIAIRAQEEERKLRKCGEQLPGVLDVILLRCGCQSRKHHGFAPHSILLDSSLLEIPVQNQTQRRQHHQRHKQQQSSPKQKKRLRTREMTIRRRQTAFLASRIDQWRSHRFSNSKRLKRLGSRELLPALNPATQVQDEFVGLDASRAVDSPCACHRFWRRTISTWASAKHALLIDWTICG